jgi:hypothetical protein
MRLEQALGSALFKRKPAVALTVLGHAVHPYLQRIVENADLARNAAQALANVRQADQAAGLTICDQKASPHGIMTKQGRGARGEPEASRSNTGPVQHPLVGRSAAAARGDSAM